MERSFVFIGGAQDDASLRTRDPKLCALCGLCSSQCPCDIPRPLNPHPPGPKANPSARPVNPPSPGQPLPPAPSPRRQGGGANLERSFVFIAEPQDDASLRTRDPKLCALCVSAAKEPVSCRPSASPGPTANPIPRPSSPLGSHAQREAEGFSWQFALMVV